MKNRVNYRQYKLMEENLKTFPEKLIDINRLESRLGGLLNALEGEVDQDWEEKFTQNLGILDMVYAKNILTADIEINEMNSDSSIEIMAVITDLRQLVKEKLSEYDEDDKLAFYLEDI